LLYSRTFFGRSRAFVQASWTLRSLFLLSAPLLAGIVLALLPSLAVKLAAVVVIAGLTLAVIMARRGHVLDPAWVIVAELYVFVPVGSALTLSGVGLSIVTALAAAFLPFVAAALVTHPTARARALRILPLIVLGLYAGASLAWSPAAPYGSEKLTFWAANGLLPALAVLVLASSRIDLSWKLILGASVAYALALIFIGEKWEQGFERQTLLGQNPVWAGRAVMTGAIIAVLGPFRLLVKVLATPVLVLAGLMTLSLGPAVGLLIGVLAGWTVLAYQADRTNERGRLIALPLLVIAMGVIAIAAFSGALEGFLAPLSSDRNVTARSDFLGEAMALFLQAPLLGVGLGGFSATGVHLYPHNVIAETAAELGVVGLLALGAWALMALRGAAGSSLLAGLVVGTGTFAVTSGSLAAQTEFWVFSALAVASLTPTLRDKVADIKRPLPRAAVGSQVP
jgi:O-antigen ligase